MTTYRPSEETGQAGLQAARAPLVQAFDAVLLDLDGVVYVGSAAVPSAVEVLMRLTTRRAYVTNNALRDPEEVAEHLRSLGLPAGASDVVTSSQAAARMLADRLPSGSAVLVCGGRGLRRAVGEAGLLVVERASARPRAVVCGYDPTLDYPRLAEASLAISAGALWVATNTDATVPTEQGLLPGNGALVALLARATGREPIVAGKPAVALHQEAVARTGSRHPLVVGDRLDTDIEGARAAGAASLLVLTGVADPSQLLRATPRQRPTFVGTDLTALEIEHAAPQRLPTGWECGGWVAQHLGAEIVVRRSVPTALAPSGDDLDPLRAACAAAWERHDLAGAEAPSTSEPDAVLRWEDDKPPPAALEGLVRR